MRARLIEDGTLVEVLTLGAYTAIINRPGLDEETITTLVERDEIEILEDDE